MATLAQSISNRLGLPILAEIPLTEDGSAPDPPDEPFLEGARFLRAGIQAEQPAHDGLSVAIVPTRHSEPALTVARYVARSFAEAGRRTTLALVAPQSSLPPLLALPAGAELPAETWAAPESLDEFAQAPGIDALVIYCPPATAALAAASIAESTVLLADAVNDTLADVRSAMAACDVAMMPATAAAVTTRPPKRRRWRFFRRNGD